MKKTFSWRERFLSFIPAFKGLKYAFFNEHNLRIHSFFALFVIILASILHLSALEWSVLLICIAFVIGAEIINSAIEEIVNFISPQYHEKAGHIKDLAAGAVLFFSLIAVAVGFIIFLPKLYQIYNHLR